MTFLCSTLLGVFKKHLELSRCNFCVAPRTTLTSLTLRRSSVRRRSRIGRLLIELDGSDDILPWRRRIPMPARIRNSSGARCDVFRLPSIFSTSPYMCSRPSSCDRMCRMPWVLSVSESLIDCVVPHVPPSNDSRSSERVVFDVRSLSSPNTENQRRKRVKMLV